MLTAHYKTPRNVRFILYSVKAGTLMLFTCSDLVWAGYQSSGAVGQDNQEGRHCYHLSQWHEDKVSIL